MYLYTSGGIISIGNFTGEFLCDEGQKNSLKRLKRERVECICGSVSESIRYKGLWVQCDACDAWQHADCENSDVPECLTSVELARIIEAREHSRSRECIYIRCDGSVI